MRCLTLVILLLGLASAQAQTYYSRAELKQPLSESVEKALAAFIERCVPEKRKQLTNHMTDVLRAVDAAAQLSAEEKLALEAEAARAVEAAVKAWPEPGLKAMRTYLSRTSSVSALRQVGGWKPEVAAPNEPVEDWTPPEENTEWVAVLRKTLGEERLKLWEVAREKLQKVEAEEIESYLKRWVLESQGPMNEDLQGQADQMKTQLKLPEETAAGLKKAADAMVEKIVVAERKRAEGMLRTMPPEALRGITGRNYFYVRFDRPRGQVWDKMWLAEAAKLLTAEELKQWEKLVEEERKKAEASVAEVIKPSEGYLRQQLDLTMGNEIDSVTSELNLDKERQDKLKALSKEAIEESVKLGRKQWAQQVLSYSAAERKRLGPNSYFGTSDENMANSLPIWKDGLKKMLTPEELERITSGNEKREQRTRAAVGRACLAEMDKTLMLNDEQRTRLAPLLAQAMQPLLEQRRQQYWSYTPGQLFQMAASIQEATVRPLLDEVQWKRWQVLVTATNPMGQTAGQTMPMPNGTQTDAVDMEAAISQHLYKMFMAERGKAMDIMMPRVEEARRVLALPEPVVARLSTAARGAVEESLEGWRENTERYVRQAVQSATPKNILQALAGTVRVNNYGGRSTESDPASSVIWQEALADMLDKGQLKQLRDVTLKRHEYRLRAMAAMSVTELDRRRHLTGEQAEKLEERVQKILADYLPDLERYMSGNWFLQYYYAMVPLAGVPEKEIQALLTPQQWKQCKERDLPDALQYWEGIENNHKNRLRQKDGAAPNFNGGFIID